MVCTPVLCGRNGEKYAHGLNAGDRRVQFDVLEVVRLFVATAIPTVWTQRAFTELPTPFMSNEIPSAFDTMSQPSRLMSADPPIEIAP